MRTPAPMPMLLPLALAAALLPLAQPKPLPAAFFTGREGGADHGTGWVEVVPPAATAPAPWPPSSPSWQVNGTTLTVTIASFRDPLCPQTLFNLFTKAAHPERVTVSVVQQNEPGDPDCLEGYCALAGGAACPHRGQVRVLNRPAREMHGPVHARSLGSRLVGDEEFCMQIDSHMDFIQGWDWALFQAWGSANNEMAVLSTYVAGYEQLAKNVNSQWEVPHLCTIVFTSEGHVRNQQAKAARNLQAATLTTLWAAGLSFSKCHFERVVPNDPWLHNIFDGEEFSRGARGFTHGYDFYTPPRTAVAHNYHRERVGGFKMEAGPSKDDAKRRIFTILEMKAGDLNSRAEAQRSAWGIGTARSLEQYAEFTGVDFANAKKRGNRCANARWVPYSKPDVGGMVAVAADLAARQWPTAYNGRDPALDLGFAWARVGRGVRGAGSGSAPAAARGLAAAPAAPAAAAAPAGLAGPAAAALEGWTVKAVPPAAAAPAAPAGSVALSPLEYLGLAGTPGLVLAVAAVGLGVCCAVLAVANRPTGFALHSVSNGIGMVGDMDMENGGNGGGGGGRPGMGGSSSPGSLSRMNSQYGTPKAGRGEGLLRQNSQYGSASGSRQRSKKNLAVSWPGDDKGD